MMRRPQRTEAACGLEARTARTFAAPLVRGLGGELKQWPRAQPSGSRLRLKREQCAEHVRQLGGESPLHNRMAVKCSRSARASP